MNVVLVGCGEESRLERGRKKSRVAFSRIRFAVAVAKSRELRKSRVNERRRAGASDVSWQNAVHINPNSDPYPFSRLLHVSSSNRPGIAFTTRIAYEELD